MLFAISAFAVTDDSRQLAQDVRSALRRGDVDLTAMALTIGTPLCRLSQQINGHEPFTLLWRVLAHMGPEAHFWFLVIRARRIGAEVVRDDIGGLVLAVRRLARERRTMARMDLSTPERKASGL